jgi:hypothetical protein
VLRPGHARTHARPRKNRSLNQSVNLEFLDVDRVERTCFLWISLTCG